MEPGTLTRRADVGDQAHLEGRFRPGLDGAFVGPRAARDALGLDQIFAPADWGGLPSGMVTDSIARYATQIAPVLRSG
jgi:hypothetical protein